MDTKGGMERENIRIAKGSRNEVPVEDQGEQKEGKEQGGELQEVRDIFVVLTNSCDSPLLPNTSEDYTSLAP